METINKNKSLVFAAALICCLLSSLGIKAYKSDDFKRFREKKECKECDLSYADLRDIKTKANLDGHIVDLEGADLTGADLSDSDLKGANFKKTNCTNALFKGSNLENTLWEDAILYRAYLTNVSLKGSKMDFELLSINSEENDFEEKIIQQQIYAAHIPKEGGLVSIKVGKDDPRLNEKKYPALYDTKYSSKENHFDESVRSKDLLTRKINQKYLFNKKGYKEHNRRKKEQEDSQ